MLADILSNELLHLGLVFCRIGSALMVLPIFGERYVMGRARLWLALAASLAIASGMGTPPTYAQEPMQLARLVGLEVIIGLFIGATVRLVVAIAHLAGGVIAMQTGLASAAFFDPSEGTQSSGTGNFLTILVLVALLVTDGHHLMLFGLAHSYDAMPPGGIILVDMAETLARLSALAFETATRIAAPLLLVGILLNVVSGVINRLMPSLQVMFVVMPVQIIVGLGAFMMSLAVTVALALDFFETSLLWLDRG